jgi:hypothetical protein
VIKRLPQFAERYFAALCSSAGVICNPSDEDEYGWDFFLQFPSKRTPGRPADMQPLGPEALVQVKSTRARPFVARLKLSNALRSVQATQPFFIVLIVPGGKEPRVYARHFWEPEIIRTLRRVRLAEREGDSQFNKRQFELRFGEDDIQDELLDWMRRTIDSVQPSYGAEKARIGQTVGHEDGFGSMDVTFEGGTDELLDLQLGLIESLPIVRASYIPERFGIAAARPEFDLEDATMFIEPIGKPGRVRFQGGSPTEELFLDATLYSAQLPGVDQSHFRWRLDVGPLRMVGGDGKYSANLTVPIDRPAPLPDLHLFLALAAWQDLGPVGLQLFLGDRRISMGSLELGVKNDRANWAELRGWVAALHRLVQTAHCADPEISVIDLYDAAILLGRFAGFVAAPSIRMEYDPVGDDDPTRAAVYFVGCDVGDWCFLAVVERGTRDDQMEGGRRRVTFGAPRILEAIVRRGSWSDHREEIETAYHAQVERLGQPDSLWELGEFEDFISRMIQDSASSG